MPRQVSDLGYARACWVAPCRQEPDLQICADSTSAQQAELPAASPQRSAQQGTAQQGTAAQQPGEHAQQDQRRRLRSAAPWTLDPECATSFVTVHEAAGCTMCHVQAGYNMMLLWQSCRQA